ncbi:hypothetical protein SDB42_06240 [Legionella pneumophila serogroup 1]
MLPNDKYHLYHWTSFEAAQSIIKDGYLLSKAMLFAKHYYDNPALLKKLKPQDVISEANNGFIDYVFLGNTNWQNYNGKSFYGEIGFVIKPEEILPTREFFVFPFNTGRYFSKQPDIEKTSDIRTLMEALNGLHSSFEILVRRRIKITQKTTSQIICSGVYEDKLKKVLSDEKLVIPIERITESSYMNKESIVLIDPLDNEGKEITLQADKYVRDNNYFYVKTELSNCILSLELNNSNELIDIYTKKKVGRFIKEIPTLFNGPNQ